MESGESCTEKDTVLTDRDHETRLEFAVLQNLDFSDRDKVAFCIRYLSENVEFLRRRNERLRKAMAEAKPSAPRTKLVVPNYWRKYKRYRHLCKELCEVDALIGGVQQQK